VLPYRHPLLTAKILATIDVLSGGRLIVGAGIGWMREEFEAFGAASYEHRGSLSDEYVRIFREVWTQELPQFEGRWYRFAGFGFQPKPIQAHVPIWIGGHSEAALRRVARLGDGWHPTALPPDEYAVAATRLRELLAARNRPLESITLAQHMEIVLDFDAHGDELATITSPDVPLAFTGNPDQVAATWRRYQALGVDHLSIEATLVGQQGTIDGRHRAMEYLAREIIPAFLPTLV
jgi:probable F420-dependent oxidoreductase